MAASCALRIFEDATICIALVICAVPRIEMMRRRRSRVLGMAGIRVGLVPALFEFADGRLQCRREIVIDRSLGSDARKQGGLPRSEELRERGLEFLHACHWNIVEVAMLDRPQHRDLHFNLNRAVLRLLENLDDALAAIRSE